MHHPMHGQPQHGSENTRGHTGDASRLDRIQALLLELNELLEGSVSAAQAARAVGAGPAVLAASFPSEVAKQLQTAAERLERMAELVNSAMQSASKPLGSPALTRSRPVTLGEAAQHALDVLSAFANAKNVTMEAQIAPAAAAGPAGALYTVILNGLLNAVESIAHRGGTGCVRLTVVPQPAPNGVGYGRDSRDWYLMEITDDGVGLPADVARCFDLGFTTKAKGSGVGLAVARNVVRGMGGTIELAPGPDGRGATLRVRFPALMTAANLTLGGAA